MTSPPPADDAQLLAAYIASRSEPAFRRLVERHLPMVRAAARRQLRDPQLADDVAQAVFLLLARKASSVRPPAMLAGWLLKVTHFTCRDALKREGRREFHERKAAAMTPALAWEAEPDPRNMEATCAHPRRVARQAARRRPRRRGHAVPRRPLDPDVAQALGVTESAAAQSGGQRAIAKLRTTFHRRGVVIPAAALIGAVSITGGTSAIDVYAAQAVSGAAMAAANGATGAIGVTVTSLAKGAGKLMIATKVKLSIVASPSPRATWEHPWRSTTTPTPI